MMARAPATADVFSAIAEAPRRKILDALVTGEKPVGSLAAELRLSQPQVSKHLRVLSEVGLVRSRATGRRRLYCLSPNGLRPLSEWMGKYEDLWNSRLDRLEDYLGELQRREEVSQKRPKGAP